MGGVKGFWDDVIGAREEMQGAISLFCPLKQTKQKSASLEPMVDLLALVVSKLSPKILGFI